MTKKQHNRESTFKNEVDKHVGLRLRPNGKQWVTTSPPCRIGCSVDPRVWWAGRADRSVVGANATVGVGCWGKGRVFINTDMGDIPGHSGSNSERGQATENSGNCWQFLRPCGKIIYYLWLSSTFNESASFTTLLFCILWGCCDRVSRGHESSGIFGVFQNHQVVYHKHTY